jgi:predicted DNA-binding protein
MPRPLKLSREVDATSLSPEDHDALLALAEERGVTKAEAMRDILHEYFEETKK